GGPGAAPRNCQADGLYILAGDLPAPALVVTKAYRRPPVPPSRAAGSRLLEEPFALARGKDSQHFAILGDGPARDVHVLRAQDLHDLLVAVGLVPGLAGDDLLDLVLHRLGGDVVATRARDRRVEEVLQLVDSLRRSSAPDGSAARCAAWRGRRRSGP